MAARREFPQLLVSHFDDVSGVKLQVSNSERGPLYFSQPRSLHLSQAALFALSNIPCEGFLFEASPSWKNLTTWLCHCIVTNYSLRPFSLSSV